MKFHWTSVIALLTTAAAAAALSCADPPLNTYPYCNTSLPVELRVADLLARMSLDEKASILDAGVPAIARLGLPSMSSGEALHGACTGCISPDKCATSFPAPIALGAAFDQQVTLFYSFGNRIHHR
jgi:beta-glucosidase